MKERGFEEFTKDEASNAASRSVPFVVKWMNHVGISAGSTAHYDLYVAIQRAINSEWEKAQAKKKEFARQRRGWRNL